MMHDDILKVLRRRYGRKLYGNGGYRYAVIGNVGNYRGFADGGQRRADAVMLSLWKSDGLKIVGFEFKVSRTDFRNELKQPDKWRGIGRFCDAWYIVAPTGVLKKSEVPDPWGLMVVTDDTVKTSKRAKPLTPEPLGREFIVDVLHRWNRAMEAIP